MSTEDTSKKLGQMLVETGRITGEQLIRAIQSQRAVGGRLGTCLLEMDVLSEDQLLEALSDQLRVPAIRIEQLRGIDEETLDLVPPKVARRCCAVPFSADRHEIHVATLDVHNLAHLDELQFCSNRRVRPHIANEVRVFEALEKYYGEEIPRRYGHLLDRLNRSRYLWDESARVLLDEPAPDSVALGGMPLDGVDLGGSRRSAIEWRSTDEAFGDLVLHSPAAHAAAVPTGAARPAPALPPADRPLTLEDADALLAREPDLSTVGEILLRYAGQVFDRTALFQLRRGAVEGWRIAGEGTDPALFARYRVGLRTPSVFANLERGGRFFLGALAPMPAHRELAHCWGGTLPPTSLLMPIRVRDRTVCVLYGDRGEQDLDGVDIDAFVGLAEKASMALELCILRRKIRSA
ncbi:MAG: hypothetical protein AAGC60_02820 [Acidobacteriota bacterium]